MADDKKALARKKREQAKAEKMLRASEIGREFLADVRSLEKRVEGFLRLVDNGDVDVFSDEVRLHTKAITEALRDEVSAFPIIKQAFEKYIDEADHYIQFFKTLKKQREQAFEAWKLGEAKEVIEQAKQTLGAEKSVKGKYGSVWLLTTYSTTFPWGDREPTDEDLAKFEVAEKHIRTKTVKIIDTAAVKADLEALVPIPYAAIKKKVTPTGKLNPTTERQKIKEVQGE